MRTRMTPKMILVVAHLESISHIESKCVRDIAQKIVAEKAFSSELGNYIFKTIKDEIDSNVLEHGINKDFFERPTASTEALFGSEMKLGRDRHASPKNIALEMIKRFTKQLPENIDEYNEIFVD